jgi:subtilisin family serine protease
VKICLKKCFLPACIIASLFAGWQGFSASHADFESSNSKNNVSSLYIDELSRITGVTVNEEAGSSALAPDSTLGLPDSDTQSVKYSQGTLALKARWSLDSIVNLSFARSVNYFPPVLIAVLDTGIDKYHEDLYGKVAAEINLSDSAVVNDVYGHGTAVAGIIAADADNGLGITGIAPGSRLVNVKVADDKGKCQILKLAEGIIWAVDHGARVINISIEFKESVPELKAAIDYAWNKGAVIIAAAGNDGDSLAIYPACYENCLAVTALKDNGTLAPLANYGNWVDVAAPGYKIYSTLPNNSYGYKYGTSFAAAYVSGLAGVLFSIVTDTNGDGRLNDEVRQAIEAGYCGTGFSPLLVNIRAAN